MNYFDKFPLINYNGHMAVNLMSRARLSNSTRAQKTMFYPYTIRDYDRVDNLSENYYDSPEYSWLIWMTNDMIDPYYDYPLSDDDFDAYIADKYGSIANAYRKVKYYRTKWVNDEAILSISEFNSLDSRYKKYYDPVVDINYGVKGYKRKQSDVITNTNRAYLVFVTGPVTNSGEFITGEEVYKVSDPSVYSECSHGIHRGHAEESEAASFITLRHVFGEFEVGDQIAGKTSGATGYIGSITLVSESLASTEADFWEPVSCYDYEYELNQKKKQIKLIDVRYRNEIEAELQRVMDTQ